MGAPWRTLDADEVALRLGQKDVAILCGAGISIDAPAALPSWSAFREAVIKEICAKLFGHQTLRAGQRLDVVQRQLLDEAIPTEIVISAIVDACGTFGEALGAFATGAPNQWHRGIAALAKRGNVSLIVTTNFDQLLEQALAAQQVSHDVLASDEEVAAALQRPIAPGRVRILKLHGCVSRPETMVVSQERFSGGLSPARRAMLIHSLESHLYVVAGYSGADLDRGNDHLGLDAAMPNVRGLVWELYGDETPRPSVVSVMNAVGEAAGFSRGSIKNTITELAAGDNAGRPAFRLFGGRDARPARHDAWLAHVKKWSARSLKAEEAGLMVAKLFYMSGMHEQATALFAALHAHAKRAGHPEAAASASLFLGHVAHASGDVDSALAHYAAVLDGPLDRHTAPPASVAAARILTALNNYDAASRLLADNIQYAKETGHRMLLAVALDASATLEKSRGRLEQAAELYQESERLAREQGDLGWSATVALNAGKLLKQMGRKHEAIAAFARSEAEARRWGDLSLAAEAIHGAILYDLLDGDRDAAERKMQTALVAAEKSRSKHAIFEVLMTQAHMQMETDLDAAVATLRRAEWLADNAQMPMLHLGFAEAYKAQSDFVRMKQSYLSAFDAMERALNFEVAAQVAYVMGSDLEQSAADAVAALAAYQWCLSYLYLANASIVMTSSGAKSDRDEVVDVVAVRRCVRRTGARDLSTVTPSDLALIFPDGNVPDTASPTYDVEVAKGFFSAQARALELARNKKHKEAVELARASQRAGHALGDDNLVASGLNVEGQFLSEAGRHEEAVGRYSEGRRLAEQIRCWGQAIFCDYNAAASFKSLGRPNDARACLERALAAAIKIGDDEKRATVERALAKH